MQLPEHLAGLMEPFIWAVRKPFVSPEHILAGSACVGWCSRTRTGGGKRSQGSFAMHRIRCRAPRQISFPVVRASGSLGSWALIPRSARPSQAAPCPAPLFRSPPVSVLCVGAALAPPPRGRGRAGRSRRAAPVAGAEAGQGRRPRRFLKAGAGGQSSVRRAGARPETGARGRRREVSAELPGRGMRVWPPSAPPAGRGRGPGAGWLRPHGRGGGSAVRWTLFTSLKTALEGRVGVVFRQLKLESRDGDFSEHQVRTAGPQGRCARAGGQGLIHCLAGSSRWCSKVDSWVISEWI